MGRMAANFDQWRKALEHLVEAAKQKQYDAVIQAGEAVRHMYPEYIGDANAYRIYRLQHLWPRETRRARPTVLTVYEKLGGNDPGDR